MTDQQRATAIRLYGNPDVETPALERLAARGVTYEYAFTPHPRCVPARAAFWTGRWPHCTGVRDNETPLPVGEADFATALTSAGYVAGLFGKNHVFRADQLDRFATIVEAGHGGPAPRGGTLVRATPIGPNGLPHGWSVEAARPRFGAGCATHPVDAATTKLVADHADAFIRQRANDG